MCVAVIYKEPVVVANATGVEAVFAGVAAGVSGAALAPAAGAAVVAVGLAAIGVGVSAAVHGESYADACARIWNNFKENNKAAIFIAGTAAAPIIHFGQEAIKGLSDSLQTVLAQRQQYETYTSQFPHGWTFSNTAITSTMVRNLFDKIPTSEYITLDATVYDSIQFLGWGTYYLNDFGYSGWQSNTMIDGKTVISIDQGSGSGGRLSFKLKCDGSTYSTGSTFNWDYARNIGYSLPAKFAIAYVTEGVQKTIAVITPNSSYPVMLYSLDNPISTNAGSIGDDVINPSNDQFYAREISALNNKIDDLQARLEAAQGKTAGQGIDAYPTQSPMAPADSDDWWTKIRIPTQQKILDLPVPAATDADKAKNAETNKTKDTTIPKEEDTPSSTPSNTPSASTPSKFTDITGGIPSVVSGVNNGFDGLNDLLKYLKDFFAFLAKGFSLLPTQLSIVFIAIIVVVVVIRFLGRGGG